MSVALGTSARPLPTTIAVTAITVLAAIVSLFHLEVQPLWNDEAFSFFVAYRSIADTIAFMRQDTQPPLYYLALTGLLRLGHSPMVLRSISAAAVVASVPLLYHAGRRLLGAPTALLAALLFALNPNVLQWSQRARPYALQTALVALAFWGFVQIWIAGRNAPWVGWLAWVIGGGLALMTQYPAGFFLLGANLAIAMRVVTHPVEETGLLWRWIVAQIAMIILWLPWLPIFIDQFSGHLTPEQMAAHHSIFLITSSAFISGLTDLLSIPTLWRAQLPFTLLYAALALVGVLAVHHRHAALPILGTSLIPVVVCIAGFLLLHPVFGYVTFNFIWLLLPYMLLIAAGIMFLPRWVRLPTLALVLMGNLWGLRNAYAIASVPLDQVSEAIRTQLEPRDGLILSRDAAARWGLAYYLGDPFAGRVAGLEVADTPIEGRPIISPAQVDSLSRIWLVLPQGTLPAFDPNTLAPIFHMALRQRFERVMLERYDRSSP